MLDSHGDIGASAGGPDGLFHCDTRFLSHLELLLNGMQPLLLGSNVRDDNTLLTVDLTNPDMYLDNHLVLPKDTLHVVRTIFLWRDTAYQRLAIRNHGDRPVDLRLTMLFDSDFADLFEVRGMRRERRGVVSRQVGAARHVPSRATRGWTARRAQTVLSFDPPPSELTATTASYRLNLAPKQATRIFFTIGCGMPQPPKPVAAPARPARAFTAIGAPRTDDATTVETSNDLFNEVLCRSMSDLYMLMTNTPQGPYPYAGIPWYSTTFGRDGMITALQMLWFDPGIAQGVLRRLAAYQAKTDDPASDAQPGKILHEMRSGEMAALREVPFGLYYGSVDATPLFVMLAGALCRAHRRRRHHRGAVAGDRGRARLDRRPGRSRWRRLRRILPRDRAGSRQPGLEGFAGRDLPRRRPSRRRPDRARRGARLCLLRQAAWRHVAPQRLGRREHARRLEAAGRASSPQRFEASFWCPELDTYALALDGRRSPAACAAPMPARSCSPASPSRTRDQGRATA